MKKYHWHITTNVYTGSGNKHTSTTTSLMDECFDRDCERSHTYMVGELEILTAAADLGSKIRFLLDYSDSWSEDGVFCFPDGDIWRKDG